MRIRVGTSQSNGSLGTIMFESGQVSFSTPAARTVFDSVKNRGVPVRKPLSDAKTVSILKSWSNGYVVTKLEKQ